MTAREAWCCIRNGERDDALRQTVFVAENGDRGILSECHIADTKSAHPRAWCFRLDDSLTWHWEMSLTPIETP